MLFPDVAKNMETANLELKKLVYLYVINYAKIMPDLAIMAINSFRKDARDKTNPFLRALAIRTMGCIRVKQITEYLLDPLKESIKVKRIPNLRMKTHTYAKQQLFAFLSCTMCLQN